MQESDLVLGSKRFLLKRGYLKRLSSETLLPDNFLLRRRKYAALDSPVPKSSIELGSGTGEVGGVA